MLRFIAIMVLIGIATASESTAQTCQQVSNERCVSKKGFAQQASKNDYACVLLSDVNGQQTAGRRFDPAAGSDYGMEPLQDILDAVNFLEKCMAANGVYQANVRATDQNHPGYESELERCNGLLYDEEFEVQRMTYNTRHTLTSAAVDTLNQAQKEGCIAIVDFTIMGSLYLPGHAVAFKGATIDKEGVTTITVNDPFNPDSNFALTYSPQLLEMTTKSEHRDLLNMTEDEWLRLSGITLKCPEENSHFIAQFAETEPHWSEISHLYSLGDPTRE